MLAPILFLKLFWFEQYIIHPHYFWIIILENGLALHFLSPLKSPGTWWNCCSPLGTRDGGHLLSVVLGTSQSGCLEEQT